MSYLALVEEDVSRTVKKSNDLVRSYYDLSIAEQKIILMAISYIESNDCRLVHIPVQLYKKYLGVSTFNYSYFDKVLRSLRSNSIVMAKINKNTDEVIEGLVAGWVDNVYYKDGFVSVDFNKEVWDHLINLKKEYTQFQLETVVQLKSKYSIRLFEILKSYQYLKTFDIKILELRRLLYLEDKYLPYNDFDKKVIFPAIEEINSIKDSKEEIHYIPIKSGRKYDAIRFMFKHKQSEFEDGSFLPPEVVMVKAMSDIEIFSSIKTMLTMKYRCMFSNQDSFWNELSFSRNALESTYLALLADEWKDHPITNHKAFFAEHLKRLS